MVNILTVAIPAELQDAARRRRINISKVCRVALADAVKKADRDAMEAIKGESGIP